jgi:hypothetical protein
MMKFDNLLIFLAVLALLSAPAISGDPLNPGMLGETMDMPLPPDLIRKAVAAGVIKSASQVTGPLPSGGQPMNLGTPTDDSLGASSSLADAGTYTTGTDAAGTDATGTADPISAGPIAPQAAETEFNLSGTLSLVLRDSATRYLNLALSQNGNAVIGHGDLTAGDSTQEVAASGLAAGGMVDLTVTPVGSPDIYRLDLQAEGNTLKGNYSILSGSGEATSGTAVGVMSNPNNTNSASVDSAPSAQPTQLNPSVSVGGAGASSDVSAKAGPVQLGQGQSGLTGSSFSSSKSISMSTNGGGSMVSSTSSTSF